ncbi:MAG: fumarylacetoacetate hydrolase family protein [Thiogranum sp.]|nr:fumarylacetoacetate hydrolase family protein [Thiogranum sp.]
MQQVKFEHRMFAPSKIVCVGRNYMAHIHELDNAVPQQPVIFLKPNSAIAADLLAGDDSDRHYEGEICFIIVNGQLAGAGFGLDITRRALQTQLKTAGLPWERAKAFDGSALFSDFHGIAGDLHDLRVELDINGKARQRGDYAQMLHKPEQLLNDIKSFMTLEDGDIIMTGTPEGVGPILRGDRYTGRVWQGETLLAEHAWQAR